MESSPQAKKRRFTFSGSFIKPSLHLLMVYSGIATAGIIGVGIVIGLLWLNFDLLQKVFTWVGAVLILAVCFFFLVRSICEACVFAGSNLII